MNSTYRQILLRRGLSFWLLVHALLWLLWGLIPDAGAGDPAPVRFTYLLRIVLAAAVAALTTGLVFFDAHLAGEDVLLANLGVSRLRMMLPVALLSVVLDGALLALWLWSL